MPKDPEIERLRVLIAQKKRFTDRFQEMIQSSLKALNVLAVIETGGIYEIPDMDHNFSKGFICGVVTELEEERFFVRVIASSVNNYKRYPDPVILRYSYSIFSPEELKPVRKEDLPLYIGWKYVSPDLHRLIAGVPLETSLRRYPS